MRKQLASTLGMLLVLMLLFVAWVFAFWPVVGDAPWERTSIVVATPPGADECDRLMRQLTTAGCLRPIGR